MSSKLSDEERVKIVTLHEENFSNRQIAKKIGRNESTVRRFLKNYEETGLYKRKVGSGRKKVTNERTERILRRLSLRDRFKTAPKLRAELIETTGINVSLRTVQRRLNEIGLKACRPAKKPLLTASMKKKRYNWAKDKENWTIDEWKNVVFSDESKFNLIGPDGNHPVRRQAGERYFSDCIQSTVKHSASVTVWGCITAKGVGRLIILEGYVNAEKYREIIDDGVIPSLEQLSEFSENLIFQDDSAPCHRAKSVSNLDYPST